MKSIQRIPRFSLRVQLAAVCLILSLFSSFAFYALWDRDARQFVMQRQTENVGMELTNMVNKVESVLENARLLLYEITKEGKDNRLYALLGSNIALHAKERLELTARIKEQVLLSTLQPYLNKLMITSLDRAVITTGLLAGLPNDFNDFMEMEILGELMESEGPGPIGICDEPLYYLPVQSIPMGRKITDSRGRVIGYIYLSLSTDLLMENLNDYSALDPEGMYITIREKTYNLQGDHFVSCELPAISGGGITSAFAENHVGTLRETGQTAVSMTFSNIPWSIVQVLPAQMPDFLSSRRTLLYIAFLGLLIFGMSLLVFNLLIGIPVSNISKGIRKTIREDCRYPFEVTSSSKEFADISENIENLRFQLLQHTERQVHLEREKRQLEFQMLQNQIQPHFVCNSLNTIKWMADMQGSTGISEISVSLSTLFRRIITTQETLIPLEEELEILDAYITVQRYRYKDLFTFEKQVENDLLKSMIPKFTLQPIVENAVFHGIASKNDFGVIRLTVVKEGDMIHASVYDDGIGMDRETIERILKEDTKNRQSVSHIGLANVNERLKYEYGPESGVTIESEPGCFTCVHIRYPYVTGNASTAENRERSSHV